MTDSTAIQPAPYAEPQVKVSEERKAEILAGLASGEIGLIEGTELLGLPDAGWTMNALRDAGMWLFRLDDAEIRRQIEEGREALRECLKPEVRAALAIKPHRTKG